MDRLGHRVDRVTVERCSLRLGDHDHDVLGFETPERNASNGSRRVEPPEESRETMFGDVVVAARREEHARKAGCSGDQVLQHRERRARCPLEVVEHQQDRAAVGDERQPTDDRFVERERITAVGGQLRMVGGGVRADELGHEPGELRAVPRPDHADIRR